MCSETTGGSSPCSRFSLLPTGSIPTVSTIKNYSHINMPDKSSQPISILKILPEHNDFNVPNFTLRTRSFNGLWSNFFNMVGVWAMGAALDFPFKSKHLSRKVRARAGIIFLLVATGAIWGGGWVFAKDAKRGKSPDPLVDV